MDLSNQRFKEKFIEEANGLLDQLEKDLLELENMPTDKGLIESAFRAMHTIKGVSGMFGFDFIGEFTHHMESIYQSIRDEVLVFNKEISEITFQSIDHLRKLLADEKLAEVSNQHKHNQLLESISKIINSVGQSEAILAQEKNTEKDSKTLHSWHILLQTSNQMFFREINLVNIFRDLSVLGKFQITRMEDMSHGDLDTWSILLQSDATEDEIREVFLFIEDDIAIADLTEGDILNKTSKDKPVGEKTHISLLDMIEKLGNQAEDNKTSGKTTQEPSGILKQTLVTKRISVDSTKIDYLMYLVSELITVNSQLNLVAKNKQYDLMKPHLEKIDALSKLFRNNAIEIRLVPLSETVLRFQRLIRDLSKLLNKKVEFVTQGINTELDKNTIDQLADPLMHLIRNCIDHGIEAPDVRLKKGKPEQGTITLAAFNSGNHVFIKISDDGTGIDIEKVRLKAVDKNILNPTDKPNIKEIYDLLFLPGFSTAASLTEVSGRGVGMDVVKKKINDLRGEIIVDSTPSSGTSFTLKLQQSLSIIDTLLFKVEKDYFTVPISEIEICNQLKKEEIDKCRHTSTIPFRDHLITFIDLRSYFNLDGVYPASIKIIIIKNDEKELALLTDKIVGEHHAVLKPLGKSLRNQKFITAASQMGDGSMAFMLDTNAIIKETAHVNMVYSQ